MGTDEDRDFLELLRENDHLRGELAATKANLDRVTSSRWWALHQRLDPVLRVLVKVVPKRERH